MQKTAQAWFTGGPTNNKSSSSSSSSSSSLLADWNAYAASSSSSSKAAPEQHSSLGFDLEAAVPTANDKLTGGTFNVRVSSKDDASTSSSNVGGGASGNGKSFIYIGLLLVGAGMFFVFIAFTMFLPVMVLVPQKFAICFTIGSLFIVASLFALKGPTSQLAHMTSKQRLPFTLIFIGTMVGTIYVSMVLHSYILSVLFSVLQVLALSYYALSYFPGGSAGLKFLSSTLTSSILKCFGR